MKKLAAAITIVMSTGVSAEMVHNQDDNILMWKGEIGEGFSEEVESKFKETGSKVFAISSGGGLVHESIRAGSFLRDNGITTMAPGQCMSACVNVFAGGVVRVVGYDTKMGIHAFSSGGDFYTKTGKEIEQSTQVVTALQTAYLAKMGVDPMMAVKAASTKSEDMDYLTLGEMMKFNLATEVVTPDNEVASNKPAPQQSKPAPKVAKAKSPSEREYTEVNGKQVEVIRFKGNWKQNKNTAGVLKHDPELSGVGIRFVPHTDTVNVTFCSDRPEFTSKQKLQVEYSLLDGGEWNDWNGTMHRAKRAKSCWDSTSVPREMIKQFKNGSGLLFAVEGKVVYMTPLTGSAKQINAAWAYKEANLMD